MEELVQHIYTQKNGMLQLPLRALEMLHLFFVSETSRAKSSRGRNSAPMMLSRHLLNTQLCICRAAQHSRAVYVLYCQGTASRHRTLCFSSEQLWHYQITQCYCLSFHSMAS